MSYGLVICGECHREIHQGKGGWYHCADRSDICPGAQRIYPASISDIHGAYCGADDLDGEFVPRKRKR